MAHDNVLYLEDRHDWISPADTAWCDMLKLQGIDEGTVANLYARVRDIRLSKRPVDNSQANVVNAVDFLRDIRPPEWIVDGIIQRSYLYGMTAHPNAGKTALAIRLALAIATGGTFGGADCSQGKVLYLCGENPEDFKLRILGALQVLGLPADALQDRLYVRPLAGRMCDISAGIAEWADLFGPISVVVVDTGAAYFSGDDENDNVAARSFGQDCRLLTTINGRPAVVVLLHPSKNALPDALTPRGGSALLAELDGNLTVAKDLDVVTLDHNKVRGPAFERRQFRLDKVALEGLQDVRGRHVSTVVAEYLSDSAAEALEAQEVRREDRLLREMRNNPDGTQTDWARAMSVNQSTVNRMLHKLAKEGLVEPWRSSFKLTRAGDKEAQRF